MRRLHVNWEVLKIETIGIEGERGGEEKYAERIRLGGKEGKRQWEDKEKMIGQGKRESNRKEKMKNIEMNKKNARGRER